MVPSLNSQEFVLFQKYIEEKCGICIGEEKAYLIESRLSKLLIDSGLTSFEELYRKIVSQNDSGMQERVVDAMTTNETLWFRDRIPWKILEEHLLPRYIDQLRSGKKTEIRIWSAASSTGQEPYSTAMLIHHYLEKHGISDVRFSQFKILATDISNTVLQIARLGKYDSISIMRGLDDTYKTKYFRNEGRVWHLDEKIKSAVEFKQFNLQNSFLFLGRFDLVFCRYVIIYFSDPLKKDILYKISNILNPEGILLIGSSEILNEYKEYFEMLEYNSGTYYRLKR